MDMFEPQDHPDDIPYPGGPPRPPYDVTGYNIAYSMGIKFDRILEGFDGPFEKLADVVPPRARQNRAGAGETRRPATCSATQVNDAFVAVNRLLKANEEVHWLKSPWTVDGKTFPTGAMYIPAKPTTLPILQKLATEKGLHFGTVASRPTDTLKLQAGAHRPVGSVRRLDAVRLDAVDLRAVRVPVRGRLSAGRSMPAT